MDLNWKAEYEIGHPEIDEDHRALIQVLDILSRGYCDRDLVDSQIKILERYVIDHFDREERLMRESGYPHLESHIVLHAQFRTRVSRMRQRWADEENLELQSEITTALSQWLVDHIQAADHDYAPWLATT